MKKRAVWHIMPHPRGWQVKRQGGKRATRVTKTQKEAINIGRRIAKNNKPSQLVIHDRDGTIREERTYGTDPEKYEG